jgi:N-acyl-L-homoserine lactone synthetase
MEAKPLAEIYEDEYGWHIKTNGEVWIDTFESEEEADTYALRNGCRVEGC